MRRNGETRVASLEAAGGLAIMTGYGDRCSKKPQGSNKMEMTTGVAAEEWNYATYRSLRWGRSRPFPLRWIVCIYAKACICVHLIARRFLEGCRAIGHVHQELKIKPRL